MINRSKMEPAKILLFISKESAVYHFTRRQVEVACGHVFGKQGESALQVIDIAEHPELAEEHNIEALPTLIVGDKRFIGTPSPETLAACLDASMVSGERSTGK